MIIRKIKFFFISLGALILAGLLVWFLLKQYVSTRQITSNRAAVIKQIQSLQRLETASFTIEKIINEGNSGDNVFQRLLFGDKILLIAHGQAIAGFDLSLVSDKDIQVEGKSLRIILPKPQLLTVVLDNTQTRVYDRQRGILSTDGNDLETKARIAAEKSIRDAACQGNILSQASDNARKQLTASFYSLGFETVSIEIPSATCQEAN
ncbi:hypothetical protein A3D03_05365 [Candidatus Gottesmanbacteria bacterium RIFCSPHIGHO2_02_FULL_40_13]|uniref:DUF4230 domain-containing protein n=1 Tax=Candidatus Gottesmanbacteria bacterium RIFCSPHIGHO2_02_FULL_40_13 TaxID=1798384 RepID=A0A1F6A7A6_9BACT|nr:MAG: hypothetical protein A3D03_05365 [Candidatus Gottesmanbacteria bacterium RIFCSPHIGHO2_02_FULL_40_13]